MKNYGLISYQNYNFKRLINIGDYIQSLAAKQYLPKVDVLIDRESLNQYSGEDVQMIMNGWYMHNPSHWPPSDSITPFYIAVHINSSCEDIMLSEKCITHFKKYEPIGCRDERTAKKLKEKGVDSYFSGCLTTTIGNTYKIKEGEKREGIYFVDPYIPFADNPHNFSLFKDAFILFFTGLPLLVTKRKLVSRVANNLYKEGYGIALKAKFISYNPIYKVFYNIFSKIAPPIFSLIFLSLYSKKFSWELLEEANYIPHIYQAGSFKSEEEKFEYAESLVKKYAKARLVITSRIHSALPCLSLETPHIYTAHPVDMKTRASRRHNSRFEGLADLFNTLSYSERRFKGVSDSKIDLNINIVNNGGHKELASALTEKCNEFIATS